MDNEIINCWNELNGMIDKAVNIEHFNVPNEISDLQNKLNLTINMFFLSKLDSESKKEIMGNISRAKEIFHKKGYFSSKEQIYFEQQHYQEILPFLNKIYEGFEKINNFDYLLNIYREGQEVFKFIQKEYDKQSSQIKSKADNLFGNLNSASLHYVYGREKENFSSLILYKSMLFYILLLVAFFILKGDGENAITLSNGVGIEEAYFLASRFLILSPIIWGILFLSRQISNDKKVEQTYLHKQVIAKSYVNYLEFIDNQNLSNADEVKSTLSRIAVEALGLNPALLLEKSTAEKIPMEELLSKLIDKSTNTISSKNTS